MTQQRLPSACVFILVLFMTGAIGHAHPSTSDSHTQDLSGVRVSTPADGRLVVNLEATGDLPGLLTLNLRVDGDGSLRGDWAFVVRYVDNTDPETGEEPPAHGHDGESHEGEEHPHRDYVRIVDRGTMAGTIDGATVTLGADGTLTDLSAALTILQGSLEFEGATGNGTATLASLALEF